MRAGERRAAGTEIVAIVLSWAEGAKGVVFMLKNLLRVAGAGAVYEGASQSRITRPGEI
jgi:hypothetical protein